MALPKKVKQGGSYFKGYQLTVDAGAGDYVLNISQTNGFMVNGIQLLPDDSGAGDYVTIEHRADTSAGAKVLETLADTIYNPGPGAAVALALPAIEPFQKDEDLRVTYTNAGGVAVSLNVYVEFIR